MGRPERLRRLHEGRRHRARRQQVHATGNVMASHLHALTHRFADPASLGGFTLIELMIVMALISILATMAVVQYRNGVRRAEESVLRTDLFRMRDAIDQYYADKNKYPASLEALVTDGYLRRVPKTRSRIPPIRGRRWQRRPIPATRPRSLASTTSRVARRALPSTDRTSRTGKAAPRARLDARRFFPRSQVPYSTSAEHRSADGVAAGAQRCQLERRHEESAVEQP